MPGGVFGHRSLSLPCLCPPTGTLQGAVVGSCCCHGRCQLVLRSPDVDCLDGAEPRPAGGCGRQHMLALQIAALALWNAVLAINCGWHTCCGRHFACCIGQQFQLHLPPLPSSMHACMLTAEARGLQPPLLTESRPPSRKRDSRSRARYRKSKGLHIIGFS